VRVSYFFLPSSGEKKVRRNSREILGKATQGKYGDRGYTFPESGRHDDLSPLSQTDRSKKSHILPSFMRAIS